MTLFYGINGFLYKTHHSLLNTIIKKSEIFFNFNFPQLNNPQGNKPISNEWPVLFFNKTLKSRTNNKKAFKKTIANFHREPVSRVRKLINANLYGNNNL